MAYNEVKVDPTKVKGVTEWPILKPQRIKRFPRIPKFLSHIHKRFLKSGMSIKCTYLGKERFRVDGQMSEGLPVTQNIVTSAPALAMEYHF